MFKRKLKKIISICLSMILVSSLAMPVYAEQPDYEFDEDTGILIIGKDIEKKPITHIVPPSIPQDRIITVFIKEGVKKINDGAFMNCKNLQTVKIPNSMKSIGSWAFKNCINLQKINIPDNVTCSHDAFDGCERYLQPTLPEAPTFLPSVPACPSDESFINSMNGWQLENGAAPYVEIPMNTFMPIISNQIQVPIPLDIKQNTDSHNSSKASISDNTSNKTIEHSESYEEICEEGYAEEVSDKSNTETTVEPDKTTFKDGLLVIGKDIEKKKITDIVSIPIDEIKSVIIEDGVTSIGDSAFEGCKGLTSVTIGNGVTSIGYNAFLGCTGLKEVTVPKKVQRLLIMHLKTALLK